MMSAVQWESILAEGEYCTRGREEEVGRVVVEIFIR